MTMPLMHWNGVPDDFNLHRASSHEAAHFVIARKLGVQNVKAYLARNRLTSPWAGTVSCPVDDAQPTTANVRRYIALAGFIVEEMHDNPGISAADILLKLDEQRNGRALFLSLADAAMAEGFDLSHVTLTQELVIQHRADIEEAATELREVALTSSEMIGSIG